MIHPSPKPHRPRWADSLKVTLLQDGRRVTKRSWVCMKCSRIKIKITSRKA
jgi:hypothetical protein